MKPGQKKKNNWLKKLTYHYRLLIINDDTYEEKFSVRLNRLNVFVWTSLFALLLILGTGLLIAFTPLKTYMPGYTDPGLRKQAVQLQLKTDSLEKALTINTFYIEQLQRVFKNEISMEEFNKIYTEKKFNPDTLKLQAGKVDSLLRKEVENREKFKVSQLKNRTAYNFTAPVKGIIVNAFAPDKQHYGVDLALQKGTPIKSIAPGKIIFSDWSAETGNTIIVKHPNNIISVYKHNKKLLRKIGDEVQEGEVIAISGNTGEKTSGPHLHFELWINDSPVNPVDFINFNN